jgi:hypothetical protein
VIAATDGCGFGRSTADLPNLNLDAHAASNLADRLEAGSESGRPQPTLASALYMRASRLRFAGALLQLIDTNPYPEIGLFTAIHPSWSYPAEQLLSVDPQQIKNQLRTHLNRTAVINSPGFLEHGEYESFIRKYQLHFHGVCAGAKLKALDRRRNKQGYVRTAEIYRSLVIGPSGKTW